MERGAALNAGPTRRALLLAPLAALCAPAAVRAADCAVALPGLFGDMVGLGVKFSQGQPVSGLQMLLELRVRWVRDAIEWSQLEPAPGRYAAFTPAFAQQLDFYRRHDIGLVALLTLGNARAYPGAGAAPHDAPAFGRFAVQVARQLQAAGVRFVLELGNEPHNADLSRALGGAWNGRPPSPWVGHYVRMVQAAVTQVKEFDPAIRLLSDDDMWLLHYRFLEAGLPVALDGFAVHPYTPGPPELTAVAHDTDWTRPFQVVDASRAFGSAVQRLREAGRKRLACTPEIWVTEWGWAVGGREVKHGIADETLAAYLPRAFIVAAAAGVQVLCWFSAHDAVDGPMGLTRHDGGRRAGFAAFQTMTAQLGALRLSRQAAGRATPTRGVQAFVFDGARRRTLVAWCADGPPRSWPWPTGAAPLAVTDHLGRALPFGTGGSRSIALGPAPVYVLTERSDADLDASLAAAA
jgi:hypothetical protein